MAATRDPTPAEIAQRCAEIQATWTPDEKLKRLRSDLRPMHMLADGRLSTMDADVYTGHHDARAELQAMTPPPAGAKGTSGF